MKKTRVRKKTRELDIYSSTLLVMRHFFKYPTTEFTLSEVASFTGLSKSTVSRIISNLNEAGFVTIVDLGVVYRLIANSQSAIYNKEKAANNLSIIIRSNITEFLVERFKNPKCIVLFGSYRRGEDSKDSDIDIAVELSDDIETEQFAFEEFKDMEAELGRRFVILAFNRKNIDDNLFINLANGVVLYGLLEVSK
ncbi:MAG: nucleotidyltransferase domain-containing protein [Candidatus Micrarchaeota archaeon]